MSDFQGNGKKNVPRKVPKKKGEKEKGGGANTMETSGVGEELPAQKRV